MKRFAALFLAAALLLGLVPFAGAAFTDADRIAEQQREAVDFASGKKIISGFPDGSFRPTDTLTRAQAAKILCTALEGAEKAETLTRTDTGFSDVPGSHWAAKYVAYCVDKGIVAGVGSGKFDPDAPLTATAFAKMLLVAYGIEKPETLTGAKWSGNTRMAIRSNTLDWKTESISDKPTTRQNACRLVYNVMQFAAIQKVEPEAYQNVKLSFAEDRNYRLLGRAFRTARGVVCDWSADGVEFTADCKGAIKLTANISSEQSTFQKFRVIVDGEPSEQLVFEFVGTRTVTAMANVQPGQHVIRVIKDTQVSKSEDTILNVQLTCKPESVRATEPRPKLLEVIGDSSSAGYGAIPTSTPDTTRNSNSIYLAAGYLVAEALGMDSVQVVKGSLGVIKTTGSPAYNYVDLYEYQNRWRDPNTKYDFPRKADVVLLKVSGNDGRYTEDETAAALKAFIETIRSHHGENVPIVLYCSNQAKHKPTAERVARETPNCYAAFCDEDRTGMGNHPSAEGQARFAEEIIKVMKPLVH